METLPNIKEFSSYSAPHKILVVGCGGTGAYVVANLVRLVKALNGDQESWQKIALIIADGDVVEEKNLGRQHFVRADLGRNKAEALAARYSSAFGMEVKFLPKYLENEDTIKVHSVDMVIGCVDNNASRRVINRWFTGGGSYEAHFWIDAGNEAAAGQVVCGYHHNSSYVSTFFLLPSAVELYPSMLEGDTKFNSQLSCAELAQSSPQNMMANVTAATLVVNYAQAVLNKEPLLSHGVAFGIDNSFRTFLNTPENLAKVNPERKKPRRW